MTPEAQQVLDAALAYEEGHPRGLERVSPLLAAVRAYRKSLEVRPRLESSAGSAPAAGIGEAAALTRLNAATAEFNAAQEAYRTSATSTESLDERSEPKPQPRYRLQSQFNHVTGLAWWEVREDHPNPRQVAACYTEGDAERIAALLNREEK